MKIFSIRLLTIITTFSLLALAKLPAATESTCRVVGIIGSYSIIRLEKTSVTGTVDEALIGTTGNDVQELDTMQFGLFDNNTSTIQVLTITAPWFDSDNNFLLQHESLGSRYLYLKILTDMGVNGELLSQPRVVLEGDILRVTSGQVIEDEIHILTLFLGDYPGNSSNSGWYRTTITLNFATQS